MPWYAYILIAFLLGITALFLRYGAMRWKNALYVSALIGVSAATAAWMIFERPL